MQFNLIQILLSGDECPHLRPHASSVLEYICKAQEYMEEFHEAIGCSDNVYSLLWMLQ